MIELYSINIDVGAESFVPLNNVAFEKGCTVVPSGTSSIALNKCGVYMVSCNGSASASTTIQLYKNGIAQPQAQSTGTSLSFNTLVTVDNSCCPCSAPTSIQIFNTTAATFTDFDVVVTKVI